MSWLFLSKYLLFDFLILKLNRLYPAICMPIYTLILIEKILFFFLALAYVSNEHDLYTIVTSSSYDMWYLYIPFSYVCRREKHESPKTLQLIPYICVETNNSIDWHLMISLSNSKILLEALNGQSFSMWWMRKMYPWTLIDVLNFVCVD